MADNLPSLLEILRELKDLSVDFSKDAMMDIDTFSFAIMNWNTWRAQTRYNENFPVGSAQKKLPTSGKMIALFEYLDGSQSWLLHYQDGYCDGDFVCLMKLFNQELSSLFNEKTQPLWCMTILHITRTKILTKCNIQEPEKLTVTTSTVRRHLLVFQSFFFLLHLVLWQLM